MVSRVLNLALRGFEFFCILIVMALVGNMIASANAGNPSLINYDMFVAVFGMLSLIYLIVSAFNDSFSGHAGIPLIVDVLNVLFLFCGAVAMAAELDVHSCSNSDYTRANHITNGANDTKKRCQEAQATTAFLWFGFAAWTASMVFSLFGARGSGINLRAPGIRKGAPAMSQV